MYNVYANGRLANSYDDPLAAVERAVYIRAIYVAKRQTIHAIVDHDGKIIWQTLSVFERQNGNGMEHDHSG